MSIDNGSFNIDDAKLGTPFYRCYVNLEQRRVVETWIYYGYQRLELTDPDCDLPYHYYKFALHGGNPNSPYYIAIPNKKHVEISMLTWEMLLDSMSDF